MARLLRRMRENIWVLSVNKFCARTSSKHFGEILQGVSCCGHDEYKGEIPVPVILFRNVRHYENFPMQNTEIYSAIKIENFTRKILIFLLFLLKA